MEADGFSKPYDPAKHKPFAIQLLGTQKSVNGWALNGIHNNKSKEKNKSEEKNKREEENESGKQKG